MMVSAYCLGCFLHQESLSSFHLIGLPLFRWFRVCPPQAVRQGAPLRLVRHSRSHRPRPLQGEAQGPQPP
jgi:hypothetical protein